MSITATATAPVGTKGRKVITTGLGRTGARHQQTMVPTTHLVIGDDAEGTWIIRRCKSAEAAAAYVAKPDAHGATYAPLRILAITDPA